MLKATGFDKAIIGVAERCGSENVIAYDANECIQILIDQGMTDTEAVEYFNFNVLDAYVGEYTPVFIWNYTLEEIDEMMDDFNEEK
tara:strand:- start:299 stop:556 length:258 start_codon:yes stop_codon:yes gene_type:complete